MREQAPALNGPGLAPVQVLSKLTDDEMAVSCMLVLIAHATNVREIVRLCCGQRRVHAAQMSMLKATAIAVAGGAAAAMYLLGRRRSKPPSSPPPPPPPQPSPPPDDEWAAAHRHDLWNLWALGILNAAHVLWWVGALDETRWLATLYALDVGYMTVDALWLVLEPACVAARVRDTLLIHHAAVLACAAGATGYPLLMRHLLRVWIVELHSWTHIAARELRSPALGAMNKPLFVGVRLIGFPLTWLVYARERTAAAFPPLGVHAVLSAMQVLMYGLMCHWGKRLLLGEGGLSAAAARCRSACRRLVLGALRSITASG